MINDITRYYNNQNVLLTADILKNEFLKAKNNKLKFETSDTLNITDLFVEFIKDQDAKKETDKTKLSYNTIRDYKYKIAKLKQYSNEIKQTITISIIDKSFVFRFKSWLIKYHNNTESSANKYIMRISRVIDFGVDAGIITKNNISDIPTPQSYQINLRHLTRSKVIRLYMHKFMTKHIQRAVDMYLFSCATGICHADQLRLTPYNVDLSKKCIIDIRQKTKTRYVAPIGYIAERLLEKYGGIENFPKISNQKCNDYIKIALYEIGISDAFEYTFHSGRKAFIDYCLNRSRNSIDPFDLIKMVGHKSVSELDAYGKRSDRNVIKKFIRHPVARKAS